MSWFSRLFKKEVKLENLKMKHGLDLSHHNSIVDFTSITDQGLVMLKATEGNINIDQKFQSRFLGLGLFKIKRGAYHFYRTNCDPITQAKHFLEIAGALKGDEILALDYETCEIKGLIQTIEDLRLHKADALVFLKYIHEATGVLPWFYTYHSVIEEVGFEAEFSAYPLWYARYTPVTPEQKQGPWNNWIAWQYSDKGKVIGVDGDVDMNWLY